MPTDDLKTRRRKKLMSGLTRQARDLASYLSPSASDKTRAPMGKVNVPPAESYENRGPRWRVPRKFKTQ